MAFKYVCCNRTLALAWNVPDVEIGTPTKKPAQPCVAHWKTCHPQKGQASNRPFFWNQCLTCPLKFTFRKLYIFPLQSFKWSLFRGHANFRSKYIHPNIILILNPTWGHPGIRQWRSWPMELPVLLYVRGNVPYLLDMPLFWWSQEGSRKKNIHLPNPYLTSIPPSYITVSPVTYIQELNMFLLFYVFKCSLNSWTMKNITSQRSTKHLKNEFNWRVKPTSSSEVSFLMCGPPKTPKQILELRRCIKGAMPLTYWKVYAMFSAWRRWSSELKSCQNWPPPAVIFRRGPVTQRFFRGEITNPQWNPCIFSHFYKGDTIYNDRRGPLCSYGKEHGALGPPPPRYISEGWASPTKMWCMVGFVESLAEHFASHVIKLYWLTLQS